MSPSTVATLALVILTKILGLALVLTLPAATNYALHLLFGVPVGLGPYLATAWLIVLYCMLKSR